MWCFRFGWIGDGDEENYFFLVAVLGLAPSVPLIFLVPAAFSSGSPSTAPLTFLATPFVLVATVVFLAGAATFFFATPAGLLPLTAVFLGPLFAPVLAETLFFVVVGSGTVGKILGRELPVALRVPSRAIVAVLR